MSKISSFIYIICVFLICTLVFSMGVWLYKNHGDEIFGDSSQIQSSSVNDSNAQNSDANSSTNNPSGSQTPSQSSGSSSNGSGSQNSGSGSSSSDPGSQNTSSDTSSNNQNDSQSSSQSPSSGNEQVPELNYTLTEYSFNLSNEVNPLSEYSGRYAIVIPMNQFSPDLPDEGYKSYTVYESVGEEVDDYLGDLSPLLYYEIKYEYGGDYFTRIVYIPKSAFTITGGQLFVTNAISDTVFYGNFFESINSDGRFISIKIISRDQHFSVGVPSTP